MPPQDSEQYRWFADEILPHEAKLRGWLHARFPSLGDIDDLVQEAYTRLLRARASGSIACARGFLLSTRRGNLALNRLAATFESSGRRRAAEIDILSVADDQEPVYDAIAGAEDLQLLIQAIQSLPNRCRRVVTLRKIYGLSQKEVANTLGISEHTVEVQGSIGIRKCTEFFRKAT